MGCLSTILSRAIFLRSADPSNLVYAEDDENAIAAAIEEHKIRPADRKRLFAKTAPMPARRFPPPWSAEETDARLQRPLPMSAPNAIRCVELRALKHAGSRSC